MWAWRAFTPSDKVTLLWYLFLSRKYLPICVMQENFFQVTSVCDSQELFYCHIQKGSLKCWRNEEALRNGSNQGTFCPEIEANSGYCRMSAEDTSWFNKCISSAAKVARGLRNPKIWDIKPRLRAPVPFAATLHIRRETNSSNVMKPSNPLPKFASTVLSHPTTSIIKTEFSVVVNNNFVIALPFSFLNISNILLRFHS